MTAFTFHGARPSPRPVPLRPAEQLRAAARDPVGRPASGAVLDLVVPARDAERDLEPFVRRLDGHLSCYFPYPYRVTVADLASADRTLAVAERLAREMPGVHAVHRPGGTPVSTLRALWSESTAPVVGALRIAPGLDLAVLPPLVAPLISGHCDLALGTDAARDPWFARTVAQRSVARFAHRRPPGDRILRRRHTGAGIVALRAEAATRVLPLLREEAGTLEAQLLALAIRGDMRLFGMLVARTTA